MLIYFNFFFLILMFLTTVVIFLFTDIEPLFDITDLNIMGIVILSYTATMLFLDNSIRAFWGQNILSDKSLFYTLFFYTNNLLLYFLLIWGIFYAHPISPLNISNIDTSVYSIFNFSIINFFFNYFFILIIITILVLQTYISFSISLKKMFAFVSIILIFLYSFLWTLFDLLLTNLTSSESLKWFGFFFNSKYSNTYSNKININFEWHQATTNIQSTGLYNSMSLFGSVFLVFFVLIFLIILCLNIKITYINNLTFKISHFFIKFISSYLIVIYIYILFIFIYLFIYYIMSTYILVNKF